MVDLADQFDDRVTTISIDLDLTVEARLHVCLLQLASPLGDSIVNDASRPAAVAAVTHLIAGGGDHAGPVLADMVPGNEPVLIVLPEFALGSPDWDAVDAAIRGAVRPLIVLAGFGATPGAAVLAWSQTAIAEGETKRRLAWNQAGENGISSVRPINGGWCWIHAGGETHCIAYLKTIAEQNVEAVQIADLQFGRTITHLRFNDLDLFPLICADMLQLAPGHPDSAQARIAGVLQHIPGDRPAMVVGSLLQHGYNINWQRAVDSLLLHVLAGRPGLVALCNVAFDKPLAAEPEDQWRSLTGVFGKWDELTKGQANLPCGRRVVTTATVGAVVRHTTAMVTSGAADWGPYGPVDGKFIWHAEMLCPVNDSGLVAPVVRPPAPHACEISRFLRRYPGDPGWSPRLAAGCQKVADHLAAGGAPTGAQILDALLDGPAPKAVDPDRLHEAAVQPAAQLGLHALATLTTIENISWQAAAEQQGQLCQMPQGRNLLVWRDAVRTKSQMRAILSRWQREAGEHPDLIVLAQSRFGDIDEGEVVEERRDDLSAPPFGPVGAGDVLEYEAGDITTPRARRRAGVVSLASVASIYADYQDGADDGPLVAALLASLAQALPEIAA